MIQREELVTLACSSSCGTWHGGKESVCPRCGAAGEPLAALAIKPTESERVMREFMRLKEEGEL